jgi:type III secretion system YscQ/HrcQ family protein
LASSNLSVIGSPEVEPVWHERLRRIAPEAAAALNELFAEKESLTPPGAPVTTWTFRPATKLDLPAAILRGVEEELWINLREDGICEHLGQREWWDYDAEARVLAWTLAHRVLIESLGRVLRESVFPIGWSDERRPPPQNPRNIVVEFTLAGADGRKSAGQIGLSAAMASRIASANGWQSQAFASEHWNALPATLRIELRSPPMPLAELIPARTGDVFVLGRRARCWSTVVVGAWLASYEDGSLRITGPAAREISRETTMIETASEDTVPQTPALSGVPVVLEFEVGALAMPLGKVAALKPGFVLQLSTRLEDARVVIRANGVRIGHGELVTVGDTLGVQVTAIDPHGLK